MAPIRVILLPGSALPAQPAYGALIEALGPDVQAVAKDLELNAGDVPPPGWSLDTEVGGVLRGLSNPDQFRDVAARLSTVFPDFRVEVFEDRHHFDPPHRIEPERLGTLLREHWDRAESRYRATAS